MRTGLNPALLDSLHQVVDALRLPLGWDEAPLGLILVGHRVDGNGARVAEDLVRIKLGIGEAALLDVANELTVTLVERDL